MHPLARALGALVAIACGVAGFWLFCEHMREGAITADWPWLYRAGQTIWQHGLPTHDTMSWTFPDYPWVLYQWLFEAVSAPIYTLLGLTGSVVAVCLLGLAMYMVGPAWYLARRGVHPLITLAIGGLVLIPVSVNFGLRPMLVSNLALLAQIVVMERLRHRRMSLTSAAITIAVIYALWANAHLGFTMGLCSLLLYALGDLFERGRPAVAASLAVIARRYLVVISAAVAAIGCNPYGWSLFGYIISLSMKTAMNAHIHELMPPDIHNGYMVTGLVLLVVYAGLTLLAWRRVAWVGLFHVALFTVGTIDALRMVVWAGLFLTLAGPPLVQRVFERYGGLARVAGKTPPARLISPALYCGLALLLAVPIATLGSAWTAGPARLDGCAPMAGGIRYLDTHLPPDARWFSSERTGSCTHAYAPERRVFIDTRFDMYPEAFVLDWFFAYQYRQNWRALFEHWHIDAALLYDDAPLVAPLTADPAYKRQRIDANSLLFTRIKRHSEP